MLSEQPAGRTSNSSTGLLGVCPSVRMETGGMTRPTIKTLWFAGGGLLATWFAVTPTPPPSARVTANATTRNAEVAKQPFDELTAQGGRLRQHLETMPSKLSTRNPFRFGGKPVVAPPAAKPIAEAQAAAVAPQPQQPTLRLSGIAEQRVDKTTVRTAVIVGDGQLYLVREGDAVAGRYHV